MTEAMPFLQKAILLSYDPLPFKAGFHAVSTRGSGRGIPNCFCRDFYFLPERFATKLASMGVRKEVIITEAATCAVAMGATTA